MIDLASVAYLEAQVDILKEEIRQLRKELKRSGSTISLTRASSDDKFDLPILSFDGPFYSRLTVDEQQ